MRGREGWEGEGGKESKKEGREGRRVRKRNGGGRGDCIIDIVYKQALNRVGC